MRRRDSITLLSSAAAAWPLPARSEQPDKVLRVGALMGFAETDPIGLRRFGALGLTIPPSLLALADEVIE